jgi:hypothetical protein
LRCASGCCSCGAAAIPSVCGDMAGRGAPEHAGGRAPGAEQGACAAVAAPSIGLSGCAARVGAICALHAGEFSDVLDFCGADVDAGADAVVSPAVAAVLGVQSEGAARKVRGLFDCCCCCFWSCVMPSGLLPARGAVWGADDCLALPLPLPLPLLLSSLDGCGSVKVQRDTDIAG